MSIANLLILMLLEVLLLLGALAVFLWLKNRRLKQTLVDAAEETTPAPAVSGTEDWLSREFARSEARLAQLQADAQPDEQAIACAELRQQLLRSEQLAREFAGNDEDEFWRVLMAEWNRLSLLPGQKEESPPAPEEGNDGLQTLSDLDDDL